MRRMMIMVLLAGGIFTPKASACTGITLQTTAGHPVAARTIEWAGNDLNSRYTIVPRGYSQRSMVPRGKK